MVSVSKVLGMIASNRNVFVGEGVGLAGVHKLPSGERLRHRNVIMERDRPGIGGNVGEL